MNKTTAYIIAGIVWLGSVLGAYFWGTQNGAKPAPASSSTNVRMAGKLPGSVGSAPGIRSKPSGDGDASPVAGQPASVASIIRQAKLKLSSGTLMNMSGLVEVGGLLKTIPFDQIPEALERVKDISNLQAKQGLYMMLLSRWAEKDGAAALAFAEDLAKESGGGMLQGGGAKMVVLQTWGQNDPDAVWEWYQQQEKGGTNNRGTMFGGNGMALLGVFGGLVAKDPDLAFKRLATVEDLQAKQMALSGMIQHIADPAVQNGLADYLDSLSESERNTATAGLMGQWAMMDPDSMMEFANARPEEERRTMLKSAGQTMLWTDPERGKELIFQNSTEDELPGVYSMIVSSMANRNVQEAEAWMNEQTQGPQLDSARAALSQTLLQSDPEKAMKWATGITAEAQREQAVSSAYQQWRQKDEAAANASLPDSGLSPDAVERLLDQVDAAQGGAAPMVEE